MELAKDKLTPKPIDSEEFLILLKDKKLEPDSEGGILILPKSELVIKILNVQGQGLLVNVTSHPAIE